MTQTRRLAAILAADVAGYSRLMGVDEEGTHARLQAHLRELVNPKIQEHRGRVVKNTGDGMLAEFPSVVDAVRDKLDYAFEDLGQQQVKNITRPCAFTGFGISVPLAKVHRRRLHRRSRCPTSRRSWSLSPFRQCRCSICSHSSRSKDLIGSTLLPPLQRCRPRPRSESEQPRWRSTRGTVGPSRDRIARPMEKSKSPQINRPELAALEEVFSLLHNAGGQWPWSAPSSMRRWNIRRSVKAPLGRQSRSGDAGQKWPIQSEKHRPEIVTGRPCLFRSRSRPACRFDGGKRRQRCLHPFDIDLGHFL